MLEHQILSAFLDKNCYESNRKYLTTISDGMKPWFATLDWWHENHTSSLTVEQLHNLHLSRHPVANNHQKQLFAKTADLIAQTQVNPEVVGVIIENKYRSERLGEFADKLIQLSEGRSKIELAQVLRDLEEFNVGVKQTHEFPPLLITADEMLEASLKQGRWKFHLPVWQDMIGGIGPGVFGLLAARPNAGKSLSAISSCFHPLGWAAQGAKIVYKGNEEAIHRTKHRAICCYSGMNYKDTKTDPEKFRKAVGEFEERFKDNVIFYHKTGLLYTKVENLLEEHKPDILIIDQLDKLHVPGDTVAHEKMRVLYTTMRENSVNYGTAIIGVSQASDAASGKKYFGFDALEHSKTGKAAELDLCICIGAENLQDDNNVRYFYIAKNKLTGREETGSYMINKEQSRMEA